MSTILVNLACLDQLASRMECLLYEVEQSKGPPVWNRFPRLEPAWPDPLRQRVEADYEQWRQLTEVMLHTGKNLSACLRQVIGHVEQIEWSPTSRTTTG